MGTNRTLTIRPKFPWFPTVVVLLAIPALVIVAWLGRNPSPFVTRMPVALIVFFAVMLCLGALWAIYRATTKVIIRIERATVSIEHRVFWLRRTTTLDAQDRIVFARIYLFSKTDPRPIQRTALLCRGRSRRWLFNDREWRDFDSVAAWIASQPDIRQRDATRRRPVNR